MPEDSQKPTTPRLNPAKRAKITGWILWRSLKTRWLANSLTVLAMVLGVGLALVVPMSVSSFQQGAIDASRIFDLLVTAEGSETQAVLNTIYYQGAPVGNMPYRVFETLAEDERTLRAVPLGFGDNAAGYPIVGTSTEYFNLRVNPSAPPYYQLAQGAIFSRRYQAVLGAQVAEQTGWQLGDTFNSAHGFIEMFEPVMHNQDYHVVGILRPTGGPSDRAIYTSLDSLWHSHGQYSPVTGRVDADHACVHLEDGPFASLTAVAIPELADTNLQVSAATDPIAATHTRYDTVLTDLPGGEYGGRTPLRIDDAGTYAFYADHDVILTLRDATGHAIAPELVAAGNDIDGCLGVANAHVFFLDEGNYTLDINAADDANIALIFEEVGNLVAGDEQIFFANADSAMAQADTDSHDDHDHDEGNHDEGHDEGHEHDESGHSEGDHEEGDHEEGDHEESDHAHADEVVDAEHACLHLESPTEDVSAVTADMVGEAASGTHTRFNVALAGGNVFLYETDEAGDYVLFALEDITISVDQDGESHEAEVMETTGCDEVVAAHVVSLEPGINAIAVGTTEDADMVSFIIEAYEAEHDHDDEYEEHDEHDEGEHDETNAIAVVNDSGGQNGDQDSRQDGDQNGGQSRSNAAEGARISEQLPQTYTISELADAPPPDARDTRDVTAILYATEDLSQLYRIAGQLDEIPGVQAVFPGGVINQLLSIVGQGERTYGMIANIILLLAVITVGLNTYANALQAQKNLAVLRAVGVGRGVVAGSVLLEAALLSLLGIVIGVAVAYTGVAIIGRIVASQASLTLPLPELSQSDWIRGFVLLPVAVAFALLPALRAARKSPLEQL